MKSKKVLWITQTAMLIALVVLSQLLSNIIPPIVLGPFKLSQLVTGLLVNLILIIGAFVPGLSAASTTALISPILAALFGIIPGQLPQMVPVVMAGNLVIVFITWLCFRASRGLGNNSATVLNVIGIVAGALLKAVTMWALTEKIIIPVLHVSAKLAEILVSTVSLPQFVTAMIGGIAALLIMPALRGLTKVRR